MARVKRWFILSRDLYFTCEHAFGKCAACILLQFLGDTSEFVYKTSYPGVRGANHRTACFYTAKNGVCQVLVHSAAAVGVPGKRTTPGQVDCGVDFCFAATKVLAAGGGDAAGAGAAVAQPDAATVRRIKAVVVAAPQVPRAA